MPIGVAMRALMGAVGRALWPDAQGYIYNEGAYEDRWIEGYTEGNQDYITATRESDHLYIRADTDFTVPGYTWVIDQPVDLTNINTVHIEWEHTGESAHYAERRLHATTNPDGYSDDDANIWSATPTERTEEVLDVSGLSGEYYIGVHFHCTYYPGAYGVLRTYRIWLE